MGVAFRMGLAIALVACSRSAPEPSSQPTLEAVVVELKDVPPQVAPEPPPPPPPVTATPEVTTPPVVKSRKPTKPRAQHTATKPAQPETKPPDNKPDPTPPKPDNKPPLETNPYIYK